MFSGIIDAMGSVAASRETPGGCELILRAEGYWQGVSAGSSIAVDGVCLTVTRIEGHEAHFDVITETLRRSTLGRLRPGNFVNLQKSLKAGDPIDGHFVQGHVDAVATIVQTERSEMEYKWWYTMDPAAMTYIIPKGSVTIDGISLTVADLASDRFSTALIPTTLERTTIGRKQEGDPVNVETDILARTVVHHLQSLSGRADMTAGMGYNP